jgi:hypothetical protein
VEAGVVELIVIVALALLLARPIAYVLLFVLCGGYGERRRDGLRVVKGGGRCRCIGCDIAGRRVPGPLARFQR